MMLLGAATYTVKRSTGGSEVDGLWVDGSDKTSQ